MTQRFLIRHIGGVAALLACGAAEAPTGGAQAALVVSCTNPYSGTSWTISIDYNHGTVDTNPAAMSTGQISWRDAKDGWNYTLDRKSGELTVAVASSTGGYFLHDRCQMPP